MAAQAFPAYFYYVNQTIKNYQTDYHYYDTLNTNSITQFNLKGDLNWYSNSQNLIKGSSTVISSPNNDSLVQHVDKRFTYQLDENGCIRSVFETILYKTITGKKDLDTVDVSTETNTYRYFYTPGISLAVDQQLVLESSSICKNLLFLLENEQITIQNVPKASVLRITNLQGQNLGIFEEKKEVTIGYTNKAPLLISLRTNSESCTRRVSFRE